MTIPGISISTPADFRNVVVYQHPGPLGTILSIDFRNLEYDESWRANAWGFAVLVGMLLFFAGMVGLPQLPFFNGTLYMWFFLLGIPALIVLFMQAKMPWTIKRTIELDVGTDLLRVLREGKAEQQHQLSRLANLTVEPHPEAEIERLARQERGDKKPTRKEQQHCLFGWFGAGGAERVMLLARAEWPCQNSLFEVRQAMLWAIERAVGADAPGRARQEAGRAPQPAMAQGLNPPLD